MQRKIAGYGWLPDLPDQRDLLFTARPATAGPLPTIADLRPGCRRSRLTFRSAPTPTSP